MPVSDKLVGNGINSFTKWEQAFRVFSNVYTQAYPGKSSELIQYNHTIYTAAQNFVWENVYAYDKEFRIHISNFPQRSWSVILQQAWTMCLKDRVYRQDENRSGNGKHKFKREACKRFNKGLCKKGFNCKYEHRCTVPDCTKLGHGVHICQMRTGNQTSTSSSNSHPTQAVEKR